MNRSQSGVRGIQNDADQTAKRPGGDADGAFVWSLTRAQLIAKTTVTVAEMSCVPGWIGVAAASARNMPP